MVDVRPTPKFPQVRGSVVASLIVAHEASFRWRAINVPLADPDERARRAVVVLVWLVVGWLA
jgi:hypothetical protein